MTQKASELLATFKRMLKSRETAQQASHQAHMDEASLMTAMREANCDVLVINTGQEDGVAMVYTGGRIEDKKVKVLKLESEKVAKIDSVGTDQGTGWSSCSNCQENLTDYLATKPTELECPHCKLKLEWGSVTPYPFGGSD